jgi:hypothetical protein
VIIETIAIEEESVMANGVVVQVALLSVSAAILMCAVVVYKKRKTQPEPSRTVPPVRVAAQSSQPLQSVQPRPARPTPALKPAVTARPGAAATMTAVIDVEGALAGGEDRHEQILAGISENIRKSLQTRPVNQYSPIPYGESKPRNTEYVRVKTEIITPHGHIRFSILKDWMSVNMLAVFRRASLEWKTPGDLIAFLPAYLEAEAEIVNGRILVAGTPGHNEKLAVPLGDLDPESPLREYFDFLSDDRHAANTPAVLLASGGDFKVISRGVITQAVFMNLDRGHAEVQVLIDRSPEALQKRYNAALQRMKSPITADARS